MRLSAGAASEADSKSQAGVAVLPAGAPHAHACARVCAHASVRVCPVGVVVEWRVAVLSEKAHISSDRLVE